MERFVRLSWLPVYQRAIGARRPGLGLAGLDGLVEDLGAAIAQFEGYSLAGSRAARNNNPGNLRAAAGNFAKDDAGYVIFPDAATGWAALYRQIQLDVSRLLSLRGLISKWAPPSENPTESYIQYVAGKVGLPDDSTPLATYTTNAPTPAEASPAPAAADSFPEAGSGWVLPEMPELPEITIRGGFSPWALAALAVGLVAVLSLFRRS